MSGSKPASARPAASSPPPAKKMKLEDGPKFVDGDLDEDLHSRQLAVYGRESMRRMAAARVLVLGIKGLGVEVGECSGGTDRTCIQRGCTRIGGGDGELQASSAR